MADDGAGGAGDAAQVGGLVLRIFTGQGMPGSERAWLANSISELTGKIGTAKPPLLSENVFTPETS
jgi:hypothetical protein